MVKRIHYSATAFQLDREVIYSNELIKPSGLWYSIECGGEKELTWPEWCAMERIGLERLTHSTEVHVHTSRILFLFSYSEIETFDALYMRGRIRWNPQILTDFAGIEVAPYCHEARLKFAWYYEWCGSSGCVWDLSSVSVRGSTGSGSD